MNRRVQIMRMLEMVPILPVGPTGHSLPGSPHSAHYLFRLGCGHEVSRRRKYPPPGELPPYREMWARCEQCGPVNEQGEKWL